MGKRVGEVIASSTTEFVAQSYELHEAPPFGSLVRVADGTLTVYGLVYNVTTESIDPGRRPLARGKEEADQESIFRNNPQLSKLFRTDFACVVVGFGESEAIFHFLPPSSPRVHAFVLQCEAEEVKAFTRSLDFLSFLLSSGQPGPLDDLIAAFLRRASKDRSSDESFPVRAGKELALLLSGDLRRLNAILRRIRP